MKITRHHWNFGLYKRIALKICICLCCHVSVYGQPPEIDQEELTVLVAKAMIDVRDGKIIPNAVIFIRGDKIEKVGSDLEIPGAAKIIDLSNKYILPGLVDAHTHLCHEYRLALNAVPGSNTITETVLLSEGDRALLGAKHAKEMLLAGYTSARDLGNSGISAAASLRDAINKGWVTGPRLFIATRALSPIGGQFVKMTNEVRNTIISKEYVEINGVQEARTAVRQAIYDGADCIKIIVNNGRLVLNQEELNAIVEEANRAGLKVAAHATQGDGPSLLAVRAGVNSIEHGYTISTAVLKLMAEKDIYLVPTDQAGVERYQKRIQRAIAAGVKIAFGSDMYYAIDGVTRGEAAVNTYRSYQEAGMTNLQILQSATMHPGNLVAGEGKIGLIEVGYLADIIGLEENPLENTQALERVSFVMQGGIVIKSENN